MTKLIAFILGFAALSFGQTTQVTHGGTGLNSTAANDVLIGIGPNTYVLATLPNCPDSSGNHFNYNSTTHVVTCGTTTGNPSGSAGGDLSGTYPNPTVAKINGNSVPSGAASHQVLVATGASTFSLKTVPDCVDTAGNHLNYTQSSDAFSCGSSGGGSGSVPTYGGAYCTASSAVGTNSSIACTSVYNVVANHVIVALCGNNQTGATTFADSGPGGGAPLTWTQIATVSNVTNLTSETAWWASPGSATGADTFTCSYASSSGFDGLVVAEILGASAGSPIDSSATKSGASSQQINLTPTSTSDLVFVGLENSGTATMPVGMFLALNATATANEVAWGSLGPYHFQLGMGTNGAAVAFAIH